MNLFFFVKTQLESLFSKFGRIISTKMLPPNPSFEGGCGFVNFADGESSIQAVKQMNNIDVDGFTISVGQSAINRTQNGL